MIKLQGWLTNLGWIGSWRSGRSSSLLKTGLGRILEVVLVVFLLFTSQVLAGLQSWYKWICNRLYLTGNIKWVHIVIWVLYLSSPIGSGMRLKNTFWHSTTLDKCFFIGLIELLNLFNPHLHTIFFLSLFLSFFLFLIIYMRFISVVCGVRDYIWEACGSCNTHAHACSHT